MRELINNRVANLAAGTLLISTTILCWSWLEHGHGEPIASCEDGECTIKLPMQDREWRRNQVCDLQSQADDMLIYCVFDVESDKKVQCYSDLKDLDKMALRYTKKFKKDFDEYPTCSSSFREKWEAKKVQQ